MKTLLVAAGGGLGALARWGVDQAMSDFSWPAATLVVNSSGAFLIGVLGVVLLDRLPTAFYLRSFVLVGLIGSYTTFSAIAIETVEWVGDGKTHLAFLYWMATLALGAIAGLSGIRLGERVAGEA